MKSMQPRFALFMAVASAGTILLSGCSGGGGAQANVSAPMPPVSATQAPLGVGGIEDRLAALEAEVGSLRRDYNNLLPAFTSLNTTSERIGALLDQAEQEQGERVIKIAPTSHATQQIVATHTIAAVPTHAAAPASPYSTQPYIPQGVRVSDPVVASTAVSRANAPAQRIAPEPVGAPVPYTAQDLHFSDRAPVAPVAPPVEIAPSNPPAVAAPIVAPRLETVARSQSVQNPQPQANAVRALRIGEHGQKTRLVLDLAGSVKPDVRYEIDNAERFMLLEMPGLPWGGVRSGAPKGSAFVDSWSVANTDGGGANLVISLKKNAKILSTEYIRGDGNRGARLVVDIGPAS